MKFQVISFHCVLKDKLGKVISSSYNQEVMTQGPGPDAMLGGLAEGLKDLKAGEKRRICLPADQAYGFYDPSKVVKRAWSEIDHDSPLELGDYVLYRLSDGKTRKLRVVGKSADLVTLDGNHPLAGQDLVFEIEATHVREATPEEISESLEPDLSQRLH